MRKNGMTIIALIICIIVMIILAGAVVIGLSKSDIINKAQQATDDMNLKNVQQIANMSYAEVYFANLTKGIRRTIESEELITTMIKNGITEQEITKYDVTIAHGDVEVSPKLKEAK